ncbi:MAG TPA: BatD family protein, partial [Pseudomonadales bacterium]|nr:BatD family protein [Pseudomonadales bacterium]
MIARVLVAGALALLSAAALARFDANVDTKVLSEADTLRLTLRADSANVSGDPDFGSLGESFEILSTQRSSEFRSINGQVDGSTAWTLLLKPKRTGTIVIPAIALGSQKSTAIEVTVRELDPEVKRAIAQTVFFETTYEPKQVYVQGQMVVTRRLFYLNGAQLYGDMPNLPEVPGAMVKSLGESEHTTAIRDGRQYGMIEQRFAVFPERSGELAIPPASVTGSVRLTTDAFGGGRRIGVDVASDPLTIQVLPIP